MSPRARPGPDEILDGIGAGRRGEVYRAHATKLERDVAFLDGGVQRRLGAVYLTDE